MYNKGMNKTLERFLIVLGYIIAAGIIYFLVTAWPTQPTPPEQEDIYDDPRSSKAL